MANSAQRGGDLGGRPRQKWSIRGRLAARNQRGAASTSTCQTGM